MFREMFVAQEAEEPAMTLQLEGVAGNRKKRWPFDLSRYARLNGSAVLNIAKTAVPKEPTHRS